jgi:enoyl-CoA hydratase/carnithine racemase
MDIADKDRLSKLLGMLGSSFSGEQANAAGMIQKMAEKYKLTINELIERAHGVPSAPRPQQSQTQRNQYQQQTQGGVFSNKTLQALQAAVNFRRHWLTPWEQEFATDVSGKYTRDYELSPKQLNVAHRIITKVARYERNGGFDDV